jgi:AFG3 family protein
LSDSLLEKETLDLNDIIGILGERPFEAKENYKAYISAKELEENVSI